jgi:predicted N-acetyltransferase YhbS
VKTTWIRTARAALNRLVSRRCHIVMETTDRREGFALFGGFQARHQFGRLYLSASGGTRTRLSVHGLATADYCRGLATRYGLVVFCGDSAPPDLAPDLLAIPVLVDLEMPTPAVFEGPGALWTRSAKANIARIKRGRFEFDVMTGDSWVAEFHRRMFRPSMRGRHGAEAWVESRRALGRLARATGSELLRVLQDGRWVAGSINQSAPDGYRLLKLGWLDGDEELLKSGVVAALYWFNFRRAAALGHQRILFGGIPPYLESGLFLYKSQWGARLSGDGRYLGEFHLLLEPSHPVCRRFLQTHSIVTTGTDRDFIVFSGHGPDDVDVSPEVLRSIKRWYTWRDQPLAVPEVTSDEVPRPLQPWLTAHRLPGSA